jgi:hypothetical protein
MEKSNVGFAVAGATGGCFYLDAYGRFAKRPYRIGVARRDAS